MLPALPAARHPRLAARNLLQAGAICHNGGSRAGRKSAPAASPLRRRSPRKSMALPRFSLRSTLGYFTLAALVVYLTSFGRVGWALGGALAIGAASCVICLAFHAGFFLACQALARLLGVEQVVARTSRGGWAGGGSVAPSPADSSANASASSAPPEVS